MPTIILKIEPEQLLISNDGLRQSMQNSECFAILMTCERNNVTDGISTEPFQ